MSRQEGGWCVHRCVFLLKRMTRRLRRESGAYHFNGPLVNLLRQATQRGAGGMNRSSGKLQAELMAVQAAPIVCFEERTPAFIGSQRFCRKNFTAEPMGMTHRLRRGSTGAALWGCCFAWVGEPKGCRGRAESPLQASMCVNLAGSSPQPGADAPTYGANGGAAALRGVVLSLGAKESTKESQRHGDSRGGPPRCALFANIGVPGTAVPGSCICSGLPVANCLRQLCPLGTRSLSAQASVCGSPTGCPRPRFAALTRREKALYCPF